MMSLTMIRAVAIGMLAAVSGLAAFQTTESTLRITIVVADASKNQRPVPRYYLLISDNPPSRAPRRVQTGSDGTVNVHIRPGNYTVESDDPFVFEGQSYEWFQTVDVVAGRDTTLALTPSNAEVRPAAASAASAGDSAQPPAAADVSASSRNGVSALLGEWEDSVLALWTPTTHASGFLIDADGLVVTNQAAIGAATAVEVQISETIKISAPVVTSNPEKDVVVLRINPSLASLASPGSTTRPIPLACAEPPRTHVEKDQELVAIGSPLRESRGPRFGAVTRVDRLGFDTDMTLAGGSSGGPVFANAGDVVGLTTLAGEEDGRARRSARIVRVERVCEVVAEARAKIANTPPPADARLPLEPAKPISSDALKKAASGRIGSLNPYQISTADFDVSFITPVMIYGAQDRLERNARDRSAVAVPGSDGLAGARLVTDFGNWSEYVLEIHPVLLVRVTPKMVESFWTKMARGAAVTQGMQLPPFKRVRTGFARMRVFCGDTEVVPIHPLKIELRASGTETFYEGLGVYDPSALTPSCGGVKLVVYSEKDQQKGDTRVVDARIIEQIRQDFAAYRE